MMGYLTDHVKPLEEYVESLRRTTSGAPLGSLSLKQAKRRWARMVSLKLIEEQGHLWTLPRGRVFRVVDRYLTREALRGRRDVTVEEALHRTGMIARYHYRLRNPRRTAGERLSSFSTLLHEIITQYLTEFYPTSLALDLIQELPAAA